MKKTILSGLFAAATVSAFANTNVNLHVVNSLTPEYSPLYNPNTQDSAVNPSWGNIITEGTWITGSNSHPGAQDFNGLLADNNHIAFYPGIYNGTGISAYLGNFQVELAAGNNLVFTVSDFADQPYQDVLETQDVIMKVSVDGTYVGSIHSLTGGEINIPADESSDIAVEFTSQWEALPLIPVQITINNNTQLCTTESSGSIGYLGEMSHIKLSCKDEVSGEVFDYDNPISFDYSGGVGFQRAWMDLQFADKISMTCEVNGIAMTSGPGNENLWQQYSQWDILANGGDIICGFNQTV